MHTHSRSTTPKSIRKPTSSSTTTTFEQRRLTDLTHLLEPSYQPSSSLSSPSSSSSTSSGSVLKRVYTDTLGIVHDPEYNLFPTDDDAMHVRRSFESQRRRMYKDEEDTDDDDDDDEREERDYEDEMEYVFGGRKTRSRGVHQHPIWRRSRYATTTHSPLSYSSSSSSSSYSPSTPYASSPTSYTYRSPPYTPTSPTFSYTVTIAPDSPTIDLNEKPSPSSPLSSTTTTTTTSPLLKLHSKLFHRRRPSIEMYDEDAEWVGDDDEDEEEEMVEVAQPPTPSIPHHPISEEQEEGSTPTCHSALTHHLRRRWDYLQLAIRLSLFRTNRRWRRRLSF